MDAEGEVMASESVREESSAQPERLREDDDGDEYETDEEILVHVEFDYDVDTKLFHPEYAFKIIGIDSENPIMQLGNQMYRGEWRDCVGTSVFFEENKNAPPTDPVFTKLKTPPLKLSCHTRKSLIMSRVFVKQKPPTDAVDGRQQTDPRPTSVGAVEESGTEPVVSSDK